MTARRRRRVAVVLSVLVLLGACTGDDDDAADDATPTTDPVPGSTSTTSPKVARDDGRLDRVALSVSEIAQLAEPTSLTFQSGSPALYVAERAGAIRKITVTVNERTGARTHRVERSPLLDISDRVVTGSERGLLGITFSPDGRKLYVSYSARPDGDTQLDEYRMETFRPDTVDEGSRRAILTVDQPRANHNGGDVHFGPDGFLYLGLGDDRTGEDESDGQDTSTLRGKLVRIDPERATPERAYAIPDGNPYADGEDGEPEIFLRGVRNPWRFSFDRETGDLWVADVGEAQWEEIDRLPRESGGGAAANLGWNAMEGSHRVRAGVAPDDAVLPLYEYSHDDGCSVIGGYVYRGKVVPALRGAYVFADYCTPGIRALAADDEGVADTRRWNLPVDGVISFGEGADGELYVLSQGGEVWRLLPGGGESTTTTARVDVN